MRERARRRSLVNWEEGLSDFWVTVVVRAAMRDSRAAVMAWEDARVDCSDWRDCWVVRRRVWRAWMEVFVDEMRWWVLRRVRRMARGEEEGRRVGGVGRRDVKACLTARSWARWDSWSEGRVKGCGLEIVRSCGGISEVILSHEGQLPFGGDTLSLVPPLAP